MSRMIRSDRLVLLSLILLLFLGTCYLLLITPLSEPSLPAFTAKVPETNAPPISGFVFCRNENTSAKKSTPIAFAAVCVLELPSDLKITVPKEARIVNITGGKMVPRFTVVQAGQLIEIIDKDNLDHSFRFIAQQREDNSGKITIQKFGKHFTETFSQPESHIIMACVIHGPEFLELTIVPNQFWATTNEDGKFKIMGNLPSGKYTLQVFHPDFGRIKKSFEIENQSPTFVEIGYPNTLATVDSPSRQ